MNTDSTHLSRWILIRIERYATGSEFKSSCEGGLMRVSLLHVGQLHYYFILWIIFFLWVHGSNIPMFPFIWNHSFVPICSKLCSQLSGPWLSVSLDNQINEIHGFVSVH